MKASRWRMAVSDPKDFKPGDKVWYSTWAGVNADYRQVEVKAEVLKVSEKRVFIREEDGSEHWCEPRKLRERKTNRIAGKNFYLAFGDLDLSQAATAVDVIAREIAPSHGGEILPMPDVSSVEFTVSFDLHSPAVVPVFISENGVRKLVMMSPQYFQLLCLFGYFSLDDVE